MGALPVGSARYPVPADALFVDSRAGDDAGDGTLTSPLRTARAAVERAAAGGTVVLRGGVYRETVFVPRPVTLQNYPGEAVWFDGSDPISVWNAERGVWSTPVTGLLDRSIGPDDGDPYISRRFPAAAEPEVLFRDGRQLHQVLGRPAAGSDTFSMDRRNKKLYIGRAPGRSSWSAATRSQALVVSAPNVAIRGIGVRGYGNSVRTQGAVYLARQKNLLENVVIEDIATTGLTFFSDGPHGTGAARHVTIRRTGLMGIGGSRADGLRLDDVLIEGSNWEHFNATPNSAGIKVTKSRNVAIEHSVIKDSLGTTGIWLDESVVGFTLNDNTLKSNGVAGISAELSSHGLITGNRVADHDFGVVIYNSGDIRISDNSVEADHIIDVDMRQDHRRQSNVGDNGHDPRYAAGDPTNRWVTENIDIECNILGPGANTARVRAVDLETGTSAEEMGIVVRRTIFVDNPGGTQALWGTGRDDATRSIADPRQIPAPGAEWNASGPRADRAVLGCTPEVR